MPATHHWGNGSSRRTSTSDHRNRRRRVLTRDNHQCQIRTEHCINTATICDHIRNVASFTNPADAETDDNCQAACVPCHSIKTLQESAAAKARKRAQLRLPTEPHPGAAP
ncbi:HNH endonuclease [Gordonia amicalis]